ncbi:MalT-like TPR region [Phytophthora infestans]|uniref:MalT-like TPR region n=1 Tax=Phytophthora infestans TaxID=4787 RepID=A0A833VW65_PHYIN|nr:MalT-like TPR region [Phytophthora infestans]KAF4134186.1 MalT-like TPR region [Phytophthora infestans]
MAGKSGDVTDEEDMDVDVGAQARLQNVTLGMKQQADELLLSKQFDKALTLYRELLMHLTRSQVTLLQQRDLVVSCHMNALAAMSKAKRWSSVVMEAAETMNVFSELQEAQGAKNIPSAEQHRENAILARAYYFRGFAYLRLGAYQPAQQDFRRALELNPDDETIQNDYKELQTALQAEQRVKQLLATSMKLFQAGNYKAAVEACVNALRESQMLQKTELTGLIHGNLAAIYVKMKDDAKAIEHYKRTMLLTRCGDKPTTAQNERVYDILDSLAGCYSRKRDYSSALSVIDDQIKLLPLCPERKDREAMMYLNGGRICYTMGRYAQAEEQLEKGHSVALNALKTQLDIALNCAYWLSKAYTKNNEVEKAMETLDASILEAEKVANDLTITDLLEKMLLARLDLLDPETNVCATESDLFKGQHRESQLWQSLEYFDGKRRICGHVRAAEVLFNFLKENGGAGGEEGRSKMLRAVALTDCVNIGKLSSADATVFMKLALAKVDMAANQSSADRGDVKDLLARLVRDLEVPGGADPSCRLQLRGTALLKLMDICIDDEEDDEEVRNYLEEAVDVLHEEDETATAQLVVLLPKIGRWRAARGDLSGAAEALEESVELLRHASNSDRLYESLVGLCVVRIRLGKLAEALYTIKEIETLSKARNANELVIIKDRLQAAIVAARDANQRKTKASEKSPLFEKQNYASSSHSFLCGISQLWWGRWCGPLIACIAAAVVALIFV